MTKILLVICGLFLYASNPEQAEFDQFVRSTVEVKVESGNALVDMLTAGIASGLAKDNTIRKNYFLFSVYTVDLSVLAALGKDVPRQVKFLAIANNFIPLNSGGAAAKAPAPAN